MEGIGTWLMRGADTVDVLSTTVHLAPNYSVYSSLDVCAADVL